MPKPEQLGKVVFLEYNQETKSFDIDRETRILPHSIALAIYVEVPNPSSQLLLGDTEEEIAHEYRLLMLNIKDDKWVNGLLECL